MLSFPRQGWCWIQERCHSGKSEEYLKHIICVCLIMNRSSATLCKLVICCDHLNKWFPLWIKWTLAGSFFHFLNIKNMEYGILGNIYKIRYLSAYDSGDSSIVPYWGKHPRDSLRSFLSPATHYITSGRHYITPLKDDKEHSHITLHAICTGKQWALQCLHYITAIQFCF